VTSLLTSPTSLAAIIDTTGNLDVLRIYSLLITCLRKSEHLLRTQQAPIHTSNLSTEDVAAKVLERVKIMRVFDFEGVVEAVAEVREGLEGLAVESKDEQPKAHDEEAAQETEPLPVPVHVPRKTVIPDSEDEDEDDEEEEMLLDHPAAAPVSKLLPEAEAEISRPKTPETKQDKEEGEGKVSFLSIDNLAHVLTPMLKKDYMQGDLLSLLPPLVLFPSTAHARRLTLLASDRPSRSDAAHPRHSNPCPQPTHHPLKPSHSPHPPSFRLKLPISKEHGPHIRPKRSRPRRPTTSNLQLARAKAPLHLHIRVQRPCARTHPAAVSRPPHPGLPAPEKQG
jgi:hypothetical protein